MEADNLERTQVEANKTWRPIEDGEITNTDEIIPSVVIYTRKRCGRFKARIVALGNRQTRVSNSEIYSPTVSHAANRYLVVEAAAEGYHLEQFDISNAFLKASLEDERVFLRLPKHWSSSPKGDVVKLLKSLYGLKVSPRKWFDLYRTTLEKDGWLMNPREPGIFRKDGMILSIYVDDSLLAGKDKQKVIAERDKILSWFPGKVIPPVLCGDVEVRDLLGATLRYNRDRRWCKISMEDAVDRLLKKFNMADCKSVATPCMHDNDLSQGKEVTTFPIRQLVGGLLYVAVITRPDISFAVQRVARCVTKCTDAVVKACKRILAYLKGTKDLGVEYSPENEENFRRIYSEIASRGGHGELPSTVAFTDSDFAGCAVTLRSTSGSILYYRGCPVVWSARQQGIRATSTCEAEYVACYDCIRIIEGQGFLDYVLKEGEFPLVFIDNMSALDMSRSSIVTKRSKHINLRFHVVRDYTKNLCWVPTDRNLADPFTKPLVGGKYLSLFHHETDDRVEENARCCFTSVLDL